MEKDGDKSRRRGRGRGGVRKEVEEEEKEEGRGGEGEGGGGEGQKSQQPLISMPLRVTTDISWKLLESLLGGGPPRASLTVLGASRILLKPL
eukprot:691669-Pyramimonas_sp.AAC.1